MPEPAVTMTPVAAKQWEISRSLALTGGQPEVATLVFDTQRDLSNALNDHIIDQGEEVDRLEVTWTCTVRAVGPLEPQKIDLHPGAPVGARGAPRPH